MSGESAWIHHSSLWNVDSRNRMAPLIPRIESAEVGSKPLAYLIRPGSDFRGDRIHCDTGWETTKPEASPGRIFPPVGCRSCQRWDTCVLLTCTCIRVGKSHPPNVTEISSLIATGCSCFWQEVRALRPLNKSNSFANWCTKSINRIIYDDEVSIHLREKFQI